MLSTYSNFHSFSAYQLETAHDILFHFDELRKLLSKVWAERTSGALSKSMAYSSCQVKLHIL